MFRIVDDLAPIICEVTDGIFNHFEIFFRSSAKDLSDMQEPSLTKYSDDGCVCIE